VVVVGAGIEADDSLLGVRNLDIVWIVVFGLLVLGSLILLWILKPWQGEAEVPGKKKKKSGWWVLPLIVALFVIWNPDFLQNLRFPQQEAPTGEVGEPAAPEVVDAPPAEVVAEATDLLLLALALAVIVVIWRVLAGRGSPEADGVETDQQLHDDMLASIDSLTLQLREGDDPRTAVLNAYATLESVLATHGGRRRVTETPTEHLRRVLARLSLDQTPFVRLVRLYEIARFSDDVITSEQRRQAIESLEQARTELPDQA